MGGQNVRILEGEDGCNSKCGEKNGGDVVDVRRSFLKWEDRTLECLRERLDATRKSMERRTEWMCGCERKIFY